MTDKVTLGSVANIDNSLLATINNNNALTTTAINNTLSRDGTTPNQMLATLDMNNFQIVNLPFPSTINSPARLVDVTTPGTITIVTALTGTSGHTVPFLDGVNTWSGIQNFNAGIIEVLTSPSVFTTSNTFNSLSVGVDNLDASGIGNLATAFNFYHNFGGSVTKGSRQSLTVVGQLTSPTSATNTSRFYVGGSFTMQAVSSDGGGIGTEKGSFFGGNSVAILNAAATNIGEVCGHEFNVTAVAGSTVLDKWGMSIVQPSNDAVSGSRNDSAVRIVNQGGAIGWNRGIQFGDGINQFPVKSSGTLIKTVSGSVTSGVDFSATTFSGNAFASPGFGIGNTGTIVSGATAVSSGNISLNGITSGSLGLQSNSTATLLTITQPVQIGVIGTTAGTLNLAGATSGSAQLSSSATGGTLQLGAGNLTIDASGNLTTTGKSKIGSTTAPVSGGDSTNSYLYGSGSNFGIYFGAGAPTISAAQGSIYLNTTGSSTSTRLYVNTTGSTTWTNFTSAA